MRNLMLLAVLSLGLSGCSSLVDSSCYQRVAVAKLTVTEVVAQANVSFENELINLDAYEKVDSLTTRANNAIEEARFLCSVDETSAKDYLNVAKGLMNDSEQYLKAEAINE